MHAQTADGRAAPDSRAVSSPQPPALILHVIHHLHIGGMENGLVNLVNRMPPGRYRHAIACVEDYSDFRNRITRTDVEVIALHRSRIGAWGLRRALFDLCRRLRPAIVHSRNLSGLDALVPAWLAGVPHRVHSEHGWDVDNLDGRKWRPALLRRLHAPLVDRYITVSKDLERFLVRRVGIEAGRITQIYNGVDTERFAPAASRPAGRLPPGFADADTLLVGTVGRAQAVKDQATLLRAFALLLERHPGLRHRLRLAVIGDGPVLADLRALAATLRIEDGVWLPGAQDHVAELLRGFDVFVLPSLNEGISNTILEAMATGLPVVATAVGGNVELVEDDVSGRFFAPGDVPALAGILERYAADSALRRAHSEAARRRAVERFSLEAMIGQYLQVYDRFADRVGKAA